MCELRKGFHAEKSYNLCRKFWKTSPFMMIFRSQKSCYFPTIYSFNYDHTLENLSKTIKACNRIIVSNFQWIAQARWPNIKYWYISFLLIRYFPVEFILISCFYGLLSSIFHQLLFNDILNTRSWLMIFRVIYIQKQRWWNRGYEIHKYHTRLVKVQVFMQLEVKEHQATKFPGNITLLALS